MAFKYESPHPWRLKNIPSYCFHFKEVNEIDPKYFPVFKIIGSNFFFFFHIFNANFYDNIDSNSSVTKVPL